MEYYYNIPYVGRNVLQNGKIVTDTLLFSIRVLRAKTVGRGENEGSRFSLPPPHLG